MKEQGSDENWTRKKCGILTGSQRYQFVNETTNHDREAKIEQNIEKR